MRCGAVENCGAVVGPTPLTDTNVPVRVVALIPTTLDLPRTLDGIHVNDTTSLSVYQVTLKEKIESFYLADNLRTRLPRLVWNNKLKQILLDANEAVKCINTVNITETSSLLYATTVVVTEALGYNVNISRQMMCKRCLPPWE